MTDGLTPYSMRHADRGPAPTGQRYPLDAYPPDESTAPAGPVPYPEGAPAYPPGNGYRDGHGYREGNVYPPYAGGRPGGPPAVAPPPLPPVQPEAWLQSELVPVMLPASLVDLLRRRVGPEGLSFYITGVLLRHEPMAALAEFHRRAGG